MGVGCLQQIKRNPLISIITVVYNGKDFIEKCIDSVNSQRCSDIEYIVIDGGSTDGTVSIIRENERKIDCWISEPDEGIYDAMNKGVGLAKGKYVYFLGADDCLLDSVSRVVDVIKHRPKDVVVFYGNVLLDGDVSRKLGGKFNKLKILYRNVPHQAMFFLREFLTENPYDLRFRYLADYALNLKIFCSSQSSIFMPIEVAAYSTNGASSVLVDNEFAVKKYSIVCENSVLWLRLVYRWLVFARYVARKLFNNC